MPKVKPHDTLTYTATTQDMAILLEAQLSENQGLTPEGYLVCRNVPVSRTGIQHYYGREISPKLVPGKLYKVYRLPEDVFEPVSLQSIESKPITDDHPQQAVTVSNAKFLSMGHGRNVRHDDNNVIAELVCTDSSLIEGIREKRKYEISLGYTANYVPYKDGFKQTNIRVNHIAIVESGRAGKRVSIRDKAPVPIKNRRPKSMDKNTALATMFAAFAKDATPEEVAEMLPFVTDAAPVAPTKTETDKSDNKGLIAILSGLITRDAKPAAKEEPLTADAIAKLMDAKLGAFAKTLKTTKDKAAKDEDEKEVEKMLEDSDEDEDDEPKKADDSDEEDDEGKKTDDEDEEEEKAKEAKDAATAVAKALRPFYKNMSTKDKKAVKDQLVALRKEPTKDGYSAILAAVKKHTRDSSIELVSTKDSQSVSDRVMAQRNLAYKKQS
jgi:hypothetical protein